MAQKFANAARATLSAGIASGDTTITINSGGSLFPEVVSPDFARAVLQDGNGIEVVLITAHTVDANSFTVTRAQEGTTARSFAAGSVFGIRVTAADMDEALDDVNLSSEVTGTLSVANGGTGSTTAQGAIDTLAGAVTSGQYLRGNGTNVSMSAIQAADVPTLNQNTTGTADNVTGTVAIANGGTGQTTRQNAMDALAGAVTSGQYLRGNGTDVVMSAIQAADVPTLNQNTTGTADNVTGVVAVANGGTGSTSLTANNVILGNGTSAVQTVAPGASGNVLVSNGTTWTSGTGGVTQADVDRTAISFALIFGA